MYFFYGDGRGGGSDNLSAYLVGADGLTLQSSVSGYVELTPRNDVINIQAKQNLPAIRSQLHTLVIWLANLAAGKTKAYIITSTTTTTATVHRTTGVTSKANYAELYRYTVMK